MQLIGLIERMKDLEEAICNLSESFRYLEAEILAETRNNKKPKPPPPEMNRLPVEKRGV